MNRKQLSFSRKSAFTLLELLLVMAISGLILSAILEVLVHGVRQWNSQASRGMSTQLGTAALDRIEREVRDAISFSTLTVGGNTVYCFTLPADKDSGSYIPHRLNNGTFEYAAGPQVAYYVSNLTGLLPLSSSGPNGCLWRATRGSGLGLWLPDTAWSRETTTQARFNSVQNLVFSTAGLPPNMVQVQLTLSSTEGGTTRTATVTRQIYLRNTGI